MNSVSDSVFVQSVAIFVESPILPFPPKVKAVIPASVANLATFPKKLTNSDNFLDQPLLQTSNLSLKGDKVRRILRLGI